MDGATVKPPEKAVGVRGAALCLFHQVLARQEHNNGGLQGLPHPLCETVMHVPSQALIFVSYLLVVVLLHFEPRGILRQCFDPCHPHLPSRGVLLPHGVYLAIAAAHSVDGVLPLSNEVLTLGVQSSEFFRRVVQLHLQSTSAGLWLR